jgi:hypothetical protein
VSCETLFADASVFQLALSTALPDEGVQLHANYLGHHATELSIAAHVLMGGARVRGCGWSSTPTR